MAREAPLTKALDHSSIAQISAEVTVTIIKAPRLASEEQEELMHQQRKAANWICSSKNTDARMTDVLAASMSSNANSTPQLTESK